MKHLIFPDYVPRPWRYALLVLLLLGLFWGAQARAQAQVNAPRMALLIGNSAYTGEWRPLPPTINDANDLGQRLAELGWQTTVLTNRTLDNMMSDVRNFVERAQAGPMPDSCWCTLPVMGWSGSKAGS